MMHKGTVTLETERLILRRFNLDDVSAVFNNYSSDPEVTKFLSWGAHGNDEVARTAIEKKMQEYARFDHYEWAIELKSIGEPIGSIVKSELNEMTSAVSVAYWIGRKWWHKGYVSEAFMAVIKFFFEQVGANRIEASHDTNNPRSGAVMRKCGLTYEGTLRQEGMSNQGVYDLAVYSILAEEYITAADCTKYVIPKYVRIQTREIAYLTGKPRGIFASVHKLLEAGKLTDDEARLFDSIDHDWFQRELANPPFYDDDKPGKPVTWFKTATTVHMLAKLQPLMDMLDRNRVPYDIVYTNLPGNIVYEDEWQVAVGLD